MRSSEQVQDARKQKGIQCRSLVAYVVFDHIHHIAQISFLGQPFSIVNTEDFHSFVVIEIRQKLGRDEEVLGAFDFAGRFHQRVMNSTFSAHVHALIRPT